VGDRALRALVLESVVRSVRTYAIPVIHVIAIVYNIYLKSEKITKVLSPLLRDPLSYATLTKI